MTTKTKVGAGIIVGVAILVITFITFFNRIPDRSIPPEPENIVSPANGTIIHIETVPNTTVSFFKKGIENILTVKEMTPPYSIVVIEMNLDNVHVQRAPIEGTVSYQEHLPGKHKNAISGNELEKLANVNETNIAIFENNDLSVGVIQVAGRAARRIQSFVDIGDTVTKGQVYGRILLGSQIVMILPQSVTVTAQVGDTTIDGETIIGTLP